MDAAPAAVAAEEAPDLSSFFSGMDFDLGKVAWKYGPARAAVLALTPAAVDKKRAQMLGLVEAYAPPSAG